jgi:hypothetical protein
MRIKVMGERFLKLGLKFSVDSRGDELAQTVEHVIARVPSSNKSWRMLCVSALRNA